MISSTVLQTAMDVAVMVRIHGPDPKRRKMRQHAFYHTESGDTTLSSSGLLVRLNAHASEELKSVLAFHEHRELLGDLDNSALVITCASTVDPFVFSKAHTEVGKVQASPKLIAGAELDVLMEEPQKAAKEMGSAQYHWSPAQLLALIDVPEASEALKVLLDTHNGGIENAWDVGWTLAKVDTNQQLHGFNAQALTEVGSKDSDIAQNQEIAREGIASGKLLHSGSLARAATRIALLLVHLHDVKISGPLLLAQPSARGDFILHIGSPFGALSPLHFFNSMSVGVVSNCWPSTSGPVSVIMADIRCLPGMEGGPVFDKNGGLVGILIQPLRQRGGGGEIQLLITSHALACSLENFGISLGITHPSGINVSQDQQMGGDSQLMQDDLLKFCGTTVQDAESFSLGSSVFSAVQVAVSSIVLVTVGDGAWASGIILNKKGLILTNAHVLEPWRYRKNKLSRVSKDHLISDYSVSKSAPYINKKDTDLDTARVLVDRQSLSQQRDIYGELLYVQLSDGLADTVLSTPTRLGKNVSSSGFNSGSTVEVNSYNRIRVRLNHVDRTSWFDARAVYVSHGPLDVALLQLIVAPPYLLPIKPEKACPMVGSTAVVLGHSLIGPRLDLCPSVTAGVVSRVVKVKMSGSTIQETPAMLETTAAVYPGGSGGAVVNERGNLIGLVTSIARHSGGTVIPHLNFSIPCAVLEAIFDFAYQETHEWSLLQGFDKPNEALSAVWALVPTTPRPSPNILLYPDPNPTPFSEDRQTVSGDRITKGSKFAKFISDKKFVTGVKPVEPSNEGWYTQSQQRISQLSRASLASALQSRM